jgi:hypothetical protein
VGKEIGTGRSIPEPVTAALVAATLTAVALLEGGFPPHVLGAVAVAAWLGVLATLLWQRPLERPTRASLQAGGALAVLVALTAFSLRWAPEWGAAFEDLVRIGGYLGLFALVTLLAVRDSPRSWLAGLAAGTVAIAALALAPRLLGIGAGDTDLAALLPAAGGRLSAPIGYWNALGSAMAIGLALLVWLGAETGSRRLAALVTAVMPLPLVTIYLTSSRGAVVATALGIAITIGLSSRRRRAVAVAAVGLAAGFLVIAVAASSEAVRDGLGAELTRGGVAVALSLVAAGAGAGWLVARLWDRGIDLRLPQPRGRTVALTAAALVALLVVVGPELLVGDLRGISDRADAGALGAGSGRSEFWRTALDGFIAEPVRGLGAGGFEHHWNAQGTLAVPVGSAHSTPFELLAELGAGGLLAFAAFGAFIGTAAVRALRKAEAAERATLGAALAVLGAGAPGFLLDWTWEFPAVFGQLIVASALIAAGPARPGLRAGAQPRAVGAVVSPTTARVAGAATAGAALLALWVGGTLFVAGSRIDAGRDALGRGDVVEAARHARAAAELQPRSSEPRLMLAEIEQVARNLDAARRQAELAARLDPDTFAPWLMLSRIHEQQGEGELSAGYLSRARHLAPRVLPRALERP